MINNILVLCIGNICRSPMAEGLLQRALPDVRVHSAGIAALVGHPADPHSIRIMEEEGIDISAHRARQLTAGLVSEAELILTMDQEQKQFVESRYVASKGKVLRLGQFGKFDIADPYRKDLDAFRQAHRLIAEGVDDFAQRIGQFA